MGVAARRSLLTASGPDMVTANPAPYNAGSVAGGYTIFGQWTIYVPGGGSAVLKGLSIAAGGAQIGGSDTMKLKVCSSANESLLASTALMSYTLTANHVMIPLTSPLTVTNNTWYYFGIYVQSGGMSPWGGSYSPIRTTPTGKGVQRYSSNMYYGTGDANPQSAASGYYPADFGFWF